MAKAELFQPHILGWLAEQIGAFSVAKGRINRRAGRRALELLANGQVLIIYPEGKRSENGKLGTAYPGAALLALKTGLPIVPVGIVGTEQLVGKWWFIRRPKIKLNIGKPFMVRVCDDKLSKEETSRITTEIMVNIAELLPKKHRGVYVRTNA